MLSLPAPNPCGNPSDDEPRPTWYPDTRHTPDDEAWHEAVVNSLNNELPYPPDGYSEAQQALYRRVWDQVDYDERWADYERHLDETERVERDEDTARSVFTGAGGHPAFERL